MKVNYIVAALIESLLGFLLAGLLIYLVYWFITK